jgi:hypothetical protein
MKEIGHQTAYKLLNHYVLLEKIDKEGVSREQVSEGYHDFVKSTLISELLIEAEALLLLKNNQVLSHQ